MTHLASDVRVPFFDLRASHDSIKDQVVEDIAELIETNAYSNGPHVAEFERAWAAYCGTQHCRGLASGLDALRLALIAAGLEQGARVVVPAQTFVATFEAVTQAGGVPTPVDISPTDDNIDVSAVAAAITPDTQFVIPVDLYGQMCDGVALRRVARDAGIEIIEDACQAHGAVRDGLRAGTIGRAAAFSFYPAKNLGAFGDAGALVTDDAALADDVTALREHGQRAKYQHEMEGFTARLDTIQALVLLRKLELLDRWNEQRRAVAALYSEGLAGIDGLSLPPCPAGSEPVWHLYVIRTHDPEAFVEYLRSRGIGTGRHYPEAPHLSAAYRHLGYSHGAFPVAEGLAREGVSLPLFPGMDESQVASVIEAIRDYFHRA